MLYIFIYLYIYSYTFIYLFFKIGQIFWITFCNTFFNDFTKISVNQVFLRFTYAAI